MKTLYSLLASAALLSVAGAGEVVTTAPGKALVEPVVPATEKSIYDKIWGLATLYENKENPLLQKLALPVAITGSTTSWMMVTCPMMIGTTAASAPV